MLPTYDTYIRYIHISVHVKCLCSLFVVLVACASFLWELFRISRVSGWPSDQSFMVNVANVILENADVRKQRVRLESAAMSRQSGAECECMLSRIRHA